MEKSQPPRHQHDHAEHSTNLSQLPKKCIKGILSFTTPRDVCRLAAVSTLFRSASNSDCVWEKFIPPQFYQILPTAVNFRSSKRELYFHLCDSILVDGGRKRFWLERSTAKIGCMLSARKLTIEWSGISRYWRWVRRNDSRFDELAELIDVCLLDITGNMDCTLLSADTEYRVVFVLKLKADSYGFNGEAIDFSLKTPEGEVIDSQEPLLQREGVANDNAWMEVVDGWMEVVAGEFTVRAAENIHDDYSSSLSFRMYSLGPWKRGLLVDGVKIEPVST